MPESRCTFRFAEFEADPRTGDLRRDGIRIKLHSQPFAVLMLLLERPGEVVTREEIRQRLWPSDTFVDFDQGVNSAILRLRQALADSAEKPRYIQTLPRLGYRFLGRAEKIIASQAGRAMLVVLPFLNLSGDPAQEYFADGLTEEIITDLGELAGEQLGIIARTSAMAYKGTPKTVAEIGRELGVEFVLEGSARREGGRVRISVQLIRASDETHLWARSYDRELRDILAVQDEIGRAVAPCIKLHLAPREAEPRPPAAPNPDSYDAYLQGRACFHHLKRQELLDALRHFERAIALDPLWAPPRAGQAMVYATLPITSDFPSGGASAAAKAAAHEALALDRNLAEAHIALCAAHFWHDWDWESAAREGREAIAIDPNSAWAHVRYGHVLSNIGRHEEAIEEAARARLLDPLGLMSNTLSGMFHFQARRYEPALSHFQRALELNPQFWVARVNFAKVLHELGRDEEALAEAKTSRGYSGGSSEPAALQGFLQARLGRRDEAENLLGELGERAKISYVPPYHVATVYLGLGDEARALEWLERGREERDVHMVFLNVDPKWDTLRPDARFRQLLHSVGFR